MRMSDAPEQDPYDSCVLHPTISDDDCETCQAEMLRRQDSLEKVMAANTLRLNKMATQGVGIDKNDLTSVRLDTFITMVVPDIRQRFIFEQTFHAQVTEIIGQMEKAMTTSKLLAPGGNNNIPPLGGMNRKQRRNQ